MIKKIIFNFENCIKFIGIIFLFLLSRRGGDNRYFFEALFIFMCIFYKIKNKNFLEVKEYKYLYLSSFLYLMMLTINFFISNNFFNGRIIDYLVMSLFSIVFLLSVIKFEVSRNEVVYILRLIAFFSVGSIINGVIDLYSHYNQLSWYRLAGRTYTTVYAGELGIYFLLGYMLFKISKNKWEKFIYLLYVIIITVLIIGTKSRNSMLMLPISLVITSIIYNRKYWIYKILSCIFIVFFLVKNPFHLKIFSRLSSLNSASAIGQNARSYIFKQGILNGMKNIWIGEGFYRHKEFTLYINEKMPKFNHYHNIFIETFATQGIFTLIGYILLLVFILFYMLKNYFIEKDKLIMQIKLIPISIFIFLILYGLAEPIFYFSKIYILLFVILSLNFLKIKNNNS